MTTMKIKSNRSVRRSVHYNLFTGLACSMIATIVTPAAFALDAMRVPAMGPLNDPVAAFWQSIPETNVPMQPQNMTTPQQLKPAVTNLTVKAAHNGQWIAFLMRWKDASADTRIIADEFGDQVAVELPIKPETNPAPMMGHKGARVSILQWRAAFQQDIEKGIPEPKTYYPNMVVDLYPDYVLRVTDATPYTGAKGLGNSVSPGVVQSTVLDQIAEGWGSLTTKPDQHGDGRGVWKNGEWQVVITHPLSTESDNDPRLSPGASTQASFAVWDGGKKEVGSRKSWANWVPVKIAE